MKRQEKFKVWDALEPTIEELREYLSIHKERRHDLKVTKNAKFRVLYATQPSVKDIEVFLEQMCCRTPLPLLYKPENLTYGVNDDWNILASEKENLVGILLDEQTLLYLKTLTKDDLKDCDNFDINAWIKEQFTIFPSRAATEQDIFKIKENCSKLEKTFAILDYHGIKVPKLCWDELVWLGEDGTFHKTWGGRTIVPHYLDCYGEFPIFSTFTEDKITMAIIRQMFQSAGT